MSNITTDILESMVEEARQAGVAGRMVGLTSADVESLLDDEIAFERQRDADNKHILMLADMMREGEWAQGSQITFSINDKGKAKLVDGQHRLRAAQSANWEGQWHLRMLGGEFRPADTYVLLDAHAKKRPEGVIGRALGFGELNPSMQLAVISAAKFQNQWRTEYKEPNGCSRPPVRHNIARVHERMPFFLQAQDLLATGSGGSAATKRKLMGGQMLAIVVETLATDTNGDAPDFWHEVTSHGNGRAGELRDRLLQKAPAKAGAFYMARLVASGWNQRDNAKLHVGNKNVPVERTSLVIHN